MNLLITLIVMVITISVIFYRWYTSELTKELKKIEDRVDKKLLILIRKNH